MVPWLNSLLTHPPKKHIPYFVVFVCLFAYMLHMVDVEKNKQVNLDKHGGDQRSCK